MNQITDNEMGFVLSIFKSPEKEYNASSIARKMGLSRMGALKIARRLEKEGIISSKEMGKAKFYSLNLSSDYVRQYVLFLLKRECEQAEPYAKVWVEDIRKLKSAEAAILFGSVLRKGRHANDIDVLFLIKDAEQYKDLVKEINDMNMLHTKRMHPMFQAREDFKNNIKKGDKPLLNAIKGIAVLGEEKIMELMER
ncbi:winged helix-turn-helix transcriptional regulator [Candidatus Woesearchaeota archaeon]|nr:winged helix-turn-helix transcriptional regulator [Candidatus Woesearchaeota archaeon]